jgi:hypothetical protein
MPDVSPTVWRGAVDWEIAPDGGARAWRLRRDRAGRAFAPELIRHATMASGVRADVVTTAERLDLAFGLDHDAEVVMDVVVDAALHQRLVIAPGEGSAVIPLPGGRHHVQVWLPQVGQLWLRRVELDGDAEPGPRPSTRWVTYGSSITHCSSAAGPSRTWPAIVARTLGWDMTSLGFGGQCHLDPIVEHTIAGLEPDVVSLCLGINVQGGASMSERTFAPQVAGFVERVRLANPTATVAVMSPIVSPPRETEPNAVGLTLPMMREAIAEVVAVLSRDDDRLHLIDGSEILGHADAHLLHDQLHPDAAGYELMGERLSARLGGLLSDAS